MKLERFRTEMGFWPILGIGERGDFEFHRAFLLMVGRTNDAGGMPNERIRWPPHVSLGTHLADVRDPMSARPGSREKEREGVKPCSLGHLHFS